MIVLPTQSLLHSARVRKTQSRGRPYLSGRPSTAPARRRRALDRACRRPLPVQARERILATADRLFYDEGIHSVGVQRVLAEASVTRVTFYRYFPSKDDLVLAYLDQRAQRARRAVEAIVDAYPDDPRSALHAWAEAFVADGVLDEYRGCTFVNAAAEYTDSNHPVRLLAVEQRRWGNDTTEDLLRALGHPRPVATTRTLQALRTGYICSAGLEESEGWAEEFLAAHDRLLDEC